MLDLIRDTLGIIYIAGVVIYLTILLAFIDEGIGR